MGFEEELERGVRSLVRRDPLFRASSRQHGAPTFRPHSDYYDTLVDAIVSQQISSRAAATISERLRAVIGGRFDPALMEQLPDEVLRGIGLSPQKLSYLRSLSRHVLDGTLDLAQISTMEDDEVVRQLVAVKGIGVWTAQMFLIFSLGRLDVLPVGDLGVRKGTQIACGLPELPTPAQVGEIASERRWSPHCSIASWYLWRAVEPVIGGRS